MPEYSFITETSTIYYILQYFEGMHLYFWHKENMTFKAVSRWGILIGNPFIASYMSRLFLFSIIVQYGYWTFSQIFDSDGE